MSKATALLGLNDAPSPAEIKEAFRKLALLHHPDSGGDPEKFRELKEACDTALEEAADRPCPNCGGKGKVKEQRGWVVAMVTCPDCGGTGYPNA